MADHRAPLGLVEGVTMLIVARPLSQGEPGPGPGLRWYFVPYETRTMQALCLHRISRYRRPEREDEDGPCRRCRRGRN